MWEANKEWLEGLQAGDQVLVRSSGIGRRADELSSKTVSRTTQTKIVVKYGDVEESFRRSNGRRFSDNQRSFGYTYLNEPTPKALEILNKQQVDRHFKSMITNPDVMNSLSTELQSRIIKLITEEIFAEEQGS